MFDRESTSRGPCGLVASHFLSHDRFSTNSCSSCRASRSRIGRIETDPSVSVGSTIAGQLVDELPQPRHELRAEVRAVAREPHDGLLAVLALGINAAIAFVHVGVEQGWWPSPLPECAAPHLAIGGSFAQRMASMPLHPAKPCDDPTFLVPGLPLSMATMNLLYALALAGGLAALLLRREWARR